MFYYVIITLLVSTFVFNDPKYGFCTDQTEIIDSIVDKILASPGWEKVIRFQVQCPHKSYYTLLYVTDFGSFSTSNLFNRNTTESNTVVNENYCNSKYDMIIYTLSCAYANAVDKFINLTKIIVFISKMERRRVRTKHGRKLREAEKNTLSTEKEKGQGNEINPDKNNCSDIPPASTENPDELMDSWKMFNSAIKQLKASQMMFDFIFDSLRFLIELAPRYYFRKFAPEFIRFGNAVSGYKDKTTNINLFLKDYIGEEDSCYKDKIGELSRQLSIFLNDMEAIDDFVFNYCYIPYNDKPQIVKKYDVFQTFFGHKGKKSKIEDKYDVIEDLEKEIKRIIDEVVQNYFIELGFVYGLTTTK